MTNNDLIDVLMEDRYESNYVSSKENAPRVYL